MNLIHPLPDGPLDIVGDIHGEYKALCDLLEHLGYDKHGHHPQGRTLVFVGDFCDRGPDSPAVMMRVKQMLDAGRAVAVLGNHELNLLIEDPKRGSGWFFDERLADDRENYAPFARPTPWQRTQILALANQLPLALERPDLRVVHAAWLPDHVAAIRSLASDMNTRPAYDHWEQKAQAAARASHLAERVANELAHFDGDLENPHITPPFLRALAEQKVAEQMGNPVKVLTSGAERQADQPFFTSGRWRFAQRLPWWQSYTEDTPVVIGHYWRMALKANVGGQPPSGPDIFDDLDPVQWFGRYNNVFCVDYSVGGRWRERKAGEPVGSRFRLAALQWPERTLRFDDGRHIDSWNFRA